MELDNAEQFDVEDGGRGRLRETDPHRLSQRQKAIDKGKNTRAYEHYLLKVPKHTRPPAEDRVYPWTPDKYEVCSVRQWHGKVRHWRLRLHNYNPGPEEGEEVIEIPTMALKGIKTVDVFQQGTKRDRNSGGGQPVASKRQSLSAAEGMQDDELLRPPAETVAKEVADAPEKSDAGGKAEKEEKTIYDDWDEDDVAL